MTRLDEPQLAELIERHIEYVDRAGRPVHLASPFVNHFHTRTDDALPIVAAIATLPIVLADGAMLAGRGLDRDRGIVFRIPPELLAILPTREQCDANAVYEAFRFLLDEWLCDVAADFTGKCILIAAALTLIERSLLPDRPAFFVTAGRRGGGKTTTLIMLLMAVTGVRPAAAAWSPNEEERRKALLAYLMEALPALIWDNIPRGTQISCPHIERSCTTAFYSDRRLGVSELVAVAASVIHFFTGNNIAPRGDLASRSLQVRLEVDRADPENRPFKHPTRSAGRRQTEAGSCPRSTRSCSATRPQARIKRRAANPLQDLVAPGRLRRRVRSQRLHRPSRGAGCGRPPRIPAGEDQLPRPVPLARGRRRGIGQPRRCARRPRRYRMAAAGGAPKKGRPIPAADLARVLNDQSEYRIDAEKEQVATLREFLFPTTPPNQTVTAKAVGKRLKRHIGEPVKRGDYTLILKEWRDPNGGPKGALSYHVQAS